MTDWRGWFEGLCVQHGWSWQYTSESRQWAARFSDGFLRVPAPYDPVSGAICAHEAAHLLNGRCPQSGDHFRGRHGCLRCETAAWERARTLLPEPMTNAAYERARRALGTYEGIPAYQTAKQAARRHRGNVAALSEEMARQRLEEKQSQVLRWKRELGRVQR